MIWIFLRKARSLGRRLQNRMNRLLAILDAKLASGDLKIEDGCLFSVPLRADGPGAVFLGKNAHFGFRGGPITGNGEILLQAREPGSAITIGKNCRFSNNITVIARTNIKIGDRCLIGDGVRIFDADFHELNPQKRYSGAGETASVTIDDNVWIGSAAIVLKGVTIGANAVVAPGAVVTKNVDRNTVVAGVPAKVVKQSI